MRYPPALSYTPRVSRVYRSTAVLIAIISIAPCATSMPVNGHFSHHYIGWIGLTALANLWLLRDAWRCPQGSLHYAQGQWSWWRENQETPGTLRLHVDLQNYMLVSFKAHAAQDKLFQTTTQWFHLEARHADHAAATAHAGAWVELRRAIYCPMQPADEAVAA